MQENEEEPDGSAPSKLWLRRCNSSPLPSLVTASEDTKTQNETEAVEALPTTLEETSNDEETIEAALEKMSLQMCKSDGGEEYPSDKENLPPDEYHGLPSRKSRWDVRGTSLGGESQRWSTGEERHPFQELQIGPVGSKWSHKLLCSPSLVSSPDSDFGSRALGLPRPQQRCASSGVCYFCFDTSSCNFETDLSCPVGKILLSNTLWMSRLHLLSVCLAEFCWYLQNVVGSEHDRCGMVRHVTSQNHTTELQLLYPVWW